MHRVEHWKLVTRNVLELPGLAAGTVTGTLIITGTPISGGGPASTLSGAIVGNYNATLGPLANARGSVTEPRP